MSIIIIKITSLHVSVEKEKGERFSLTFALQKELFGKNCNQKTVRTVMKPI